MKNNADYKPSVDLHRRLRTFNVGDYVTVRLRPERFPLGTVKKLHARTAGPFQILKKLIQMLMWWISHRTSASVAL